MALHVSVAEVQQWLETTKLTTIAVDAQLEATAAERVLSAVARIYDVTTWVSETTTPSLIRKIIAMLVAAWSYDRQYSEDTVEGSAYGERLEERAMMLLQGILDGTLDLLDIVDEPTPTTSGPVFHPDDSTGRTQQYDAAGHAIGGEFDADTKFQMGMRF